MELSQVFQAFKLSSLIVVSALAPRQVDAREFSIVPPIKIPSFLFIASVSLVILKEVKWTNKLLNVLMLAEVSGSFCEGIDEVLNFVFAKIVSKLPFDGISAIHIHASQSKESTNFSWQFAEEVCGPRVRHIAILDFIKSNDLISITHIDSA